MSALLTVRDLHVRFNTGGPLARALGRDTHIEGVAGVDLDIAPGETMALVGESGSGKTTLARAVAGLGGDITGEVLFDGKPVAGRTGGEAKALRRDVAFMFQDAVSSLSPRFTIRGLIEEPFRIHGQPIPEGEVERLLGLVGLSAEMADRRPHELSGGQARRVGVARALALEPRLVIADEPTAGLDVSVQSEVLNLLNDLRERLDLAILIITHNLNIVRHVADKMAIMYLGRFVEIGETQAIFAQPRHPYTKALLSANPIIDAEARRDRIALEGEVPSLTQRPEGCEFHGRCPFARDLCAREAPDRTREPARSYTCHFPLEEEAPA
ncbi:oligopeptide/dipeptide ABC transporter ATP-binding protein [Pseudoroseicyclus aestuarii]|uniref:Peptide/nickel transport system ATP-binding protein n=1 Tax=Pseudoroseicyclus aestuarii TaxID=1795041 RepID=A0A318SPV5_9RHOB|nr:ABC transporter ATP-binding protein [Pseudoroseicyclus aestuarii]PYE82378.1 peptide/nickel transport system ATP-binding protein [Pseudoroseicyclus aestuarii]